MVYGGDKTVDCSVCKLKVWCMGEIKLLTVVYGNLKVWCMGEIRSVETPLTINTQATIYNTVAQHKRLYGQ